MNARAIVLDANILIRAVLGNRVRKLILEHAPTTQFFAPDVAYEDARKYLPALLEKRGLDSSVAMTVLDSLEKVVFSLDRGLYERVQEEALRRIAIRDADDWPVLACAMVIGCPIWTEDADFFGTGVATWTSDRVELYLTSDIIKKQYRVKKSGSDIQKKLDNSPWCTPPAEYTTFFMFPPHTCGLALSL